MPNEWFYHDLEISVDDDGLVELRSELTGEAQAQADLESDLPHKFVVNRAQPADKKAYPIRWLVVAISGIAALLLALLLIVVQENVKKIRNA